MRSDRNEELQRLEEALLETEQPQQVIENTMVFSSEEIRQHTCTVRSTDRVDVDMEEYSARVQQPAGSVVKPSVVAMLVLLTAAFLAVIVWWLLRMRGLI